VLKEPASCTGKELTIKKAQITLKTQTDQLTLVFFCFTFEYKNQILIAPLKHQFLYKLTILDYENILIIITVLKVFAQRKGSLQRQNVIPRSNGLLGKDLFFISKENISPFDFIGLSPINDLIDSCV